MVCWFIGGDNHVGVWILFVSFSFSAYALITGLLHSVGLRVFCCWDFWLGMWDGVGMVYEGCGCS